MIGVLGRIFLALVETRGYKMVDVVLRVL